MTAPKRLADAPNALKVKEAAGLLNVSAKTVYRMVSDGQIQSVKARGAIRIPKDSLRRFLGVEEGGEWPRNGNE